MDVGREGGKKRRRDERCFWVLRFGKKSSLSQTIEIPETGIPETGEVDWFEVLRTGS